MNLFDLTGRKAIVTGGSRGLGRGLAEGLHEAGAEVVIVGTTDQVSTVADEIGKSGAKTYGVKGDLSNRAQLGKIFDEAVAKLGGTLDILVNCAGIQRRNPCVDFKIQDWDDVIELNLTSVFLLSQMAAKLMLEKGSGKIINVASMLSFFGGLTVPAYAASKGGLAQLTKAFSNELAGKGVNVNAIAPGYMATQLNTALINNPARNCNILARIPAGRWGNADDLKGIVILLASGASDYINGAVIPVDGGYLGC